MSLTQADYRVAALSAQVARMEDMLWRKEHYWAQKDPPKAQRAFDRRLRLADLWDALHRFEARQPPPRFFKALYEAYHEFLLARAIQRAGLAWTPEGLDVDAYLQDPA